MADCLANLKDAGLTTGELAVHNGPYNSSEKPSRVQATWIPKEGRLPLIVRWMVTEWCNYSCSYCPQTHDRFAAKGAFTAHAFDNFPLDHWIDAFERHFAARHVLSMVITGGEPLLDVRHMPPLLAHLTRQDYVSCIRIDTNASWAPEKYAHVDKSKLILMCTFHPGQVSEQAFCDKLDRIREAGFRIGMVNYVMERTNIELFQQRHRSFWERGLILHPNPLWESGASYSADDLELMQRHLPKIDFQHRSKLVSPQGEPCLFPSISYELRYTGEIRAGCATAPSDFFSQPLPARPRTWSPCPHASCVCLDKYSFRMGSERNVTLNPLADYADALQAKAFTNASTAGPPLS
jgi:organic radical activating enzyme